jgi:hypothetical protein
MKEDYDKISKLRFRDRITSGDINFIQSMHKKYCDHLKKNICWQCPNSIREALFDLLNYVEKNPLKDESENIDESGYTEIGDDSESIPGKSKSGKRSNSSKK